MTRYITQGVTHFRNMSKRNKGFTILMGFIVLIVGLVLLLFILQYIQALQLGIWELVGIVFFFALIRAAVSGRLIDETVTVFSILVRLLKHTVYAGVIVFAILMAGNYFGVCPQDVVEDVMESLRLIF